MAKNTASRIVAARDKLGITDAELARRVGVVRSQVHAWVHGDHEPTLGSLRKIAKALKCDVVDLMGAS